MTCGWECDDICHLILETSSLLRYMLHPLFRMALQYIQFNKASDSDWFTVSQPTNNGQNWSGKCW